ncbi:MAG TPA: WYL domain-containing protein [Mycobacteriales bacterium]|nr:WYL domain-containing protein [Mycobacteriales bacterium]
MATESEAGPTARALLALELIQDSPGITAQRLGEKLGVSERAARRYVGTLREAGIALESERGPYGGYRVGRGIRLPPMTFSAAEALGLVMAVLDGHHDAGDAADPVGNALGKLVRALPAAVAAQAEAVRRTTAPAPDRAAARPDPQITMDLVQACAGHRPVRLSYRSESGTQWSTSVDPWAIVVRHGRWYLLCRSHRSGERRGYRVDRVLSVATLPGSFEPPAELDAVAELEDHLAAGWDYEVEVVVDAPVGTVTGHLSRMLGRIEAIDATTTRVTATTGNPFWYAERLVALPAPYRIVRGPEVRWAARRIAARLLAAAGPDEPGADEAARAAGADPDWFRGSD